MKRIFAAELKRAVNYRWIISIIGVLFSICFDSWNDLINGITSKTGYVHYIFWNSSWGGVCRSYFLPIFAALPFALSFCAEYKSHSFPYILSRESKKNYCMIKYIVNALCGGAVVGIATALLLFLLSSVFPMVDERYYVEDIQIFDRMHMWSALHHPAQYICIEILSGFLRGVLWSSVALCVSVYLTDAMVVLASPYIISFMVVQAYRLFRIDDTYRLDKLLTGNMIIKSSVYTVGICTICVALITFAGYILFWRAVRWRLKNGAIY